MNKTNNRLDFLSGKTPKLAQDAEVYADDNVAMQMVDCLSDGRPILKLMLIGSDGTSLPAGLYFPLGGSLQSLS